MDEFSRLCRAPSILDACAVTSSISSFIFSCARKGLVSHASQLCTPGKHGCARTVRPLISPSSPASLSLPLSSATSFLSASSSLSNFPFACQRHVGLCQRIWIGGAEKTHESVSSSSRAWLAFFQFSESWALFLRSTLHVNESAYVILGVHVQINLCVQQDRVTRLLLMGFVFATANSLMIPFTKSFPSCGATSLSACERHTTHRVRCSPRRPWSLLSLCTTSSVDAMPDGNFTQ